MIAIEPIINCLRDLNFLTFKLIFFFLTSQNVIYIAKIKQSPPHKMCQEELQQYYSGINTKERKRNTKTLVDAQTKQWGSTTRYGN
jgi:hypothetical protein